MNRCAALLAKWCRDRWRGFRWQDDRIQIAANEGRLLSLQPGDQFVLFGEIHCVQSRTGGVTGEVIRCRYRLGKGELVVERGVGRGDTDAELWLGDDRRTVFPEDLML